MSLTDLARLVDQFNSIYAGRLDGAQKPRLIPVLRLPQSYRFDDSYQAIDLRVSKVFSISERWRFRVIGEVFNLYNAANLSGFSGDLTSPAFGQPTARYTHVFGSGGPRAFQIAVRGSF
jgi:hypothetical protein